MFEVEWVSVKDKLPEPNQDVIAIGTWEGELSGELGSKTVGIGYWQSSFVWLESDETYARLKNITHWMPALKLPDGLVNIR